VGNFAFTSLLFLLLALPGYVFRSCYNSGEFTRQLLSRTWTDDVAKAFLYSIPFHVIGLEVFEWLQHSHRITHSLTWEVPFRLLTGEYTQIEKNAHGSIESMVGSLYSNQGYVLGYFGLILILAFSLGHVLRKAVWIYELDVKWPWLFRFKSEWLYQVMGRGKLFVPHRTWLCRMLGIPAQASVRHRDTIVILDAVTDQATEERGKTQLYSGIVAGFTVDETGALSEILLVKTKRGKFLMNYPMGRSHFVLEDIPGRAFMLRYSTVKNLNLTYLPAP
jgi:hypothetical protein